MQVNYRIFQSLKRLSIDEIDIEVYQWRKFVLFYADLGSHYEI